VINNIVARIVPVGRIALNTLILLEVYYCIPAVWK
jgi:hypothetical protein